MMALFWKDARINRLVLICGLICLMLPFAAAVALHLYEYWRYGETGKSWFDTLTVAGVLSLGISLLTIAMLGGNAVAGERQDRSIEFLAYLPPSRAAIIASKAALAIGASLLIWGFGLAVLYIVAPLTVSQQQGMQEFRGDVLGPIAATAVMLFGVAWLCSTFSSSPAVATGAGIFAPVVLAGVLQAVAYFFNVPELAIGWWHATLCVVLGTVAFVAGTAYYIRRVEP